MLKRETGILAKRIEIGNFKSIKHLEMDCSRINVLIGKPNTGKSNILEAIGLFSARSGDIRSYVRLEETIDLFYDHDISEEIKIFVDMGSDVTLEGIHKEIFCECKVTFQQDQFRVEAKSNNLDKILKNAQNFSHSITLGYLGESAGDGFSGTSPFRFYRFAVLDSFRNVRVDFLAPPKGNNLLSIILTNKELKSRVNEIFSEYGLRVVLEPQEKKMKLLKEVDGIFVSYPYSLASDTLQRLIFHIAAIETNKNAVLIFEEPEAHAFPFYTKFLAEKIVRDKTNQYFVATHNPYFLLPLVEKATKEEVNVFVTYWEDNQTKIKLVNRPQLSRIIDLDLDVFFNLENFLEG
ncbi:MAG: AAA family ATPase [Candidatus Edwardsbacteria bacterium]